MERLKSDFSQFLGRRVAQEDRTDGLKLIFDDGSWILLRLSGTEPLMRVYTETPSQAESARLAEEARAWVFAAAAGGSEIMSSPAPTSFWSRHARTILGLAIFLLAIHDVFGSHGLLAMRRTQKQIQDLHGEIDRLNKENTSLSK